MSFGDFYTRVCEQLKAGYGWRGAVMYLAVNTDLLNIIYDQYQANINDMNPSEFQGLVEATALKVDRKDQAAA